MAGWHKYQVVHLKKVKSWNTEKGCLFYYNPVLAAQKNPNNPNCIRDKKWSGKPLTPRDVFG